MANSTTIHWPFWSCGKLRLELARVGFRPRRKLGQNFLSDRHLLEAIVRDARVGPGDRVLEVGPGAGALTAPLLSAGARVIGVEIDPVLAGVLRVRFDGAVASPESPDTGPWTGAPALRVASGLTLIVGDVLSHRRLAPAVVEALRRPPPFKVVSNLPFAAGTAFLMELCLETELGWTEAVCTVQREVADRLVSPPGTREYGLTSVLAQTFCRVRRVRRVSRQAFWPRPAVDAAVVSLVVRDEIPLDRTEGPRFAAFCRRLFSFRRKTLRNGLSRTLAHREEPPGVGARDAAAALADLAIPAEARVETLAPEQLVALFQRVVEK